MFPSVLITDKPRFTVKPKDTIAYIGATVKLYCKAEGLHAPALYWLKNGEYLTSLKAFQRDGYLQITELEEKDSGIYQCFASNTMGTTQTSALLTVPKYGLLTFILLRSLERHGFLG